MIQQSPTEERALPLASHILDVVANYTDAVRNGGEYADSYLRDLEAMNGDVVAETSAKLMALASQAAQPAEADGVERLRAEIERQCSIDAGTFTVDDGFAQSGLWQINADLDPNGLASALAVTPKAPATDAGEVERRDRIAMAISNGNWSSLEEFREWAANHSTYPNCYKSTVDERYASADRVIAALATPPAPNDDLRAALAAMLREFDADEFGSEGQMQVCAKARAALASTQPAPAFPREEVTEAIRQAKVKADKVHGVAWYNLEEISRVELILAALLQGKQP